jgi:conserved domain protein
LERGKAKMDTIQISLKAARVNAGLTQVEAAKKIGKSPNTIILWENGTIAPDRANLYLLAGIYGIPVDNIFLPRVSTNSRE